MSLDTAGQRAALMAHDIASASDPDSALAAVLDRSRRRDRIRWAAGAAVVVVLLVGIGVAAPLLRGLGDNVRPISELPDTNLQIPIIVGVPEGFRAVRDRPWALLLDARDELTSEQPWPGFTIHRPDGVIDPQTQEVRPLPGDLADWIRTYPNVHVLAERTVNVAGQQALQWDIQPKSIQSALCYTVDSEPINCGNSLTRFRVTLLDIDGMPVFVRGGVPRPFWPLPEQGTPGDAYDAFLGSIHVR
jgi:hypothetical protein